MAIVTVDANILTNHPHRAQQDTGMCRSFDTHTETLKWMAPVPSLSSNRSIQVLLFISWMYNNKGIKNIPKQSYGYFLNFIGYHSNIITVENTPNFALKWL